MKRALPILLAAVMLVAGVALAPAHAAMLNLTSGNSTVTFTADDPDLPLSGQGGGVVGWVVDGISQLYQQTWFVALGNNAQVAAATLPSSIVTQTSDYVRVAYTGSHFTLTTTYSLLGGAPGSGTSDLSEQALVTNTSNTSRTIHLFLYADFDLGGTAAGDTVTITGKNDALQTGKGWTADTIVGPSADVVEANVYPNTLNSLNSGAKYTLNGTKIAGPDDVTWALEWNISLAPSGSPGSSYLLSLDKIITGTPVPVPPSAILLGSGLLGLVGFRFRKNLA